MGFTEVGKLERDVRKPTIQSGSDVGCLTESSKPKSNWNVAGHAFMSKDLKYVLIVIDGKLYSCFAENLFDLTSGYCKSINVKRLD